MKIFSRGNKPMIRLWSLFDKEVILVKCTPWSSQNESEDGYGSTIAKKLLEVTVLLFDPSQRKVLNIIDFFLGDQGSHNGQGCHCEHPFDLGHNRRCLHFKRGGWICVTPGHVVSWPKKNLKFRLSVWLSAIHFFFLTVTDSKPNPPSPHPHKETQIFN